MATQYSYTCTCTDLYAAVEQYQDKMLQVQYFRVIKRMRLIIYPHMKKPALNNKVCL